MFNRLYVDDIFALFSFPDHADKFKEYVSTGHPSIIISLEKKKDDCLPSQDLKFLVKTRNFQLTFIEKYLSAGFIPASKGLS